MNLARARLVLNRADASEIQALLRIDVLWSELLEEMRGMYAERTSLYETDRNADI